MTQTPVRPDAVVDPFYPDSDGQPMAESDLTRDGLIYAVEALRLYFQARPEVYVSGNLFIYYQQGVRDAVVAPDVFVVFGAGNQPRKSYKVWEENGLTPDFAIEITSETTRRQDSVEKARLYADLGVTEYFQYDPSGDYLVPPLQGRRLVEGEYQPLAAKASKGESLSLLSAVLGLELRLEGGELRFYPPETGEKLRSYREAELSRREAEVARQAAEAARQEAEARQQEAEARQQEAEARQQEAEARQQEAEAARQEAEARSYRAAERLLAAGMSLDEVAAIAELPIAALRNRFE